MTQWLGGCNECEAIGLMLWLQLLTININEEWIMSAECSRSNCTDDTKQSGNVGCERGFTRSRQVT